MAKKKTSKKASAVPAADPATLPPEEPKRVVFGGALTRDMSRLPGILEKFLHVSRRYALADFLKNRKEMEEAFSHINAEEITDDFGKKWPPGSLLHIGSDCQESGGIVLCVHKFTAFSAMYPPISFKFLQSGEKF